MEWLCKAGVTAGMVVLVMLVARHGGRRCAGVAAALPTVTAPTLAWVAHEQGLAFAVHAAIASVSACALLALFSVGYAVASRHAGRCGALGCGLLGALVPAWPAFAASTRLGDALLLGLGCSALAIVGMPQDAGPPVARPRARRSVAWTALAAGGVTALAATAGAGLGSFAAGLLSSLPVIGAAVAMAEHAHGGHRAAAGFLHGYAWGLVGKAAFGTVFVLLAPHLGACAALLLACGVAGLMSLLRPVPRPLAMRPRPRSPRPGME